MNNQSTKKTFRELMSDVGKFREVSVALKNTSNAPSREVISLPVGESISQNGMFSRLNKLVKREWGKDEVFPSRTTLYKREFISNHVLSGTSGVLYEAQIGRYFVSVWVLPQDEPEELSADEVVSFGMKLYRFFRRLFSR